MVLAASSVFLNGQRKSPFTPPEKAFYVELILVAFIRPGLVISIVSASIASDGTISVDYKLSDSSCAPLDRSGTTPGSVSTSFLAAYIPEGQEPRTVAPTAPSASASSAISLRPQTPTPATHST